MGVPGVEMGDDLQVGGGRGTKGTPGGVGGKAEKAAEAASPGFVAQTKFSTL